MQRVMMEEELLAKNGRFTITIGDALFLGIIIIGVIMRFVGLGSQPLTPDEAEAAWAAWAFWQPDSLVLAEGSPLYFSLTRLLTPILGFSDGTMRLVPALFGLGVVALPWLWRSRLGTVGALVMSLFLAVSPLHTHSSRFAGGDATAVFCILLLLIAALQFIETEQTKWLYTAVVALALGISSTPLFYSGLLTLGIAWGIYYFLIGSTLVDTAVADEEAASDDEPEIEPEIEAEARRLAMIDAPTRRTAVLLGAGVFIAVTTLFLWNPLGIGTAVRLPTLWLEGFGVQPFASASSPFLAFFRYQPGLVLLGLLGMGWATWHNHPLGSLCIYWFAALILLTLIQPAGQNLALLMTLSSSILVALFSSELLADPWHQHKSITTVGSFTLLMLIWVNLARILRVGVTQLDNLAFVWVALFIGLLIILLILLASQAYGVVTQGAFVAALLFFVFYAWGTAWWLGHDGFHDTRERWVTSGTDDDIRVLVPVIDELSQQVANSAVDLEILSRVDTAVLRWYLRDYVNLEFADTIPVTADSAVIITPATTELTLGNDYLGSDYGLIRQKPDFVISETVLFDTLRWWFFQETPTPLTEERVILWLRSDLTRNGN